MERTGIADLPLHPGRAPRWLFERMVKLAREIFKVIIYEYDSKEVLRRISDPFWFQALSCVLGFDWHSSGCTTVTCGALKEALDPNEFEIAIAGGKGKTSLKTPEEINEIGTNFFNFSTNKISKLTYASKMVAKVDNAALQDGYQLYHHMFIFSKDGEWAVIQQGMNPTKCYARRYHWLSEKLDNFVVEPHVSILCDSRENNVLDMTSRISIETQKVSLDLVNDDIVHLKNDWTKLLNLNQKTLDRWISNGDNKEGTYSIEYLHMPRNINWGLMKKIYELQPRNYEELLSIRGVGPSTVRALALISDLIYGAKPSWKDPVKYSFAVGGKDGVPYPVDRKAMDEATKFLQMSLEEAVLGKKEKFLALKRLRSLIPND